MRFASKLKTVLPSVVVLIACFCICSQPYATDLRFVSGRSALKIPFELHQNQIYLQVRVNGSEPLWFIFDTGARTILNRKSAQPLKLKLRGQKQVYVTGEERPVESLPNIVLTVSETAVLPLEEVERCAGRTIDGVLGQEIFSRSVVEIDYRAKTINLYKPSGYNYLGKGVSVPLEMTENNLIFVRASIKPSQRPSPTVERRRLWRWIA